LIRYAYTPDETLGLLRWPADVESADQLTCWTVESAWKDNRCFLSCIPDGTYMIQAFESERHPNCFVISPVEGRTGILFHAGNDSTDVQGCIAVGLSRIGVKVFESRDAMRMLNYYWSRNEQHQIRIGPGLGAVLPGVFPGVHPGDDGVPGGDDLDDDFKRGERQLRERDLSARGSDDDNPGPAG
jgi:hypothetical protein